MCSAGSSSWSGECSTQYGREATSKDPSGQVSADSGWWPACSRQQGQKLSIRRHIERKAFPRTHGNSL